MPNYRARATWRAPGAGVAQTVEQRTENPCVGGSIPPPGTARRRSKLPRAPLARFGEFRSGVAVFVKGGAPFHTFPPVRRAANQRFAAIVLWRVSGAAARQRSETTYRRPRKSARTAWNADLRSAQRPAGPRRQRSQPSGWLPSRRVPLKDRMACDSGPPPGELATGLRPASRGSAKPAPMTLRPANVSPPLLPTPNGAVGHRFALPGIAPFHAGEGERADPIIWVSPGGGRRRCASAQRDARY